MDIFSLKVLNYNAMFHSSNTSTLYIVSAISNSVWANISTKHVQESLFVLITPTNSVYDQVPANGHRAPHFKRSIVHQRRVVAARLVTLVLLVVVIVLLFVPQPYGLLHGNREVLDELRRRVQVLTVAGKY